MPEPTAEERLTELQRDRATMLALIRDLVDSDPCWFDHHGGCQAHGYLSLEPGQQCPHAEAKELLERHGDELAAYDKEANDGL